MTLRKVQMTRCSCSSLVAVNVSTVGARTVCDSCGNVYDEDCFVVMKLPPKISTGLHDKTYSEIQSLMWDGIESTTLPVGLRDRFTDDALTELTSHPSYQDFPNHFKSWVWSALDAIYHDNEEVA